MTFLDEEGNKVEFEAVARIFLEEKNIYYNQLMILNQKTCLYLE